MDADGVLLSVIVPAYRTGAWLHRSLGSLLAQTYTRFEVIFSDDGSDDGTLADAAAILHGDPRFRLLTGPHTGTASAARNRGIREAAGDALVFLDSDDELEKDALERIAAAFEKHGRPDVLCCVFQSGFEKNGTFHAYSSHQNLTEADGVLTGVEVMERRYKSRKNLVCNSYSAVYRRSFLLDNKIFQNESLTLLEDSEWLPRVLFSAQRVAALDGAYYHYFKRADSLAMSFSPGTLASAGKSAALLLDFFMEHRVEMTEKLRFFWCGHAVNSLLWFFFHPRYRKCYRPADWFAAWHGAHLWPGLRAAMPYLSRWKRWSYVFLLMADAGFRLPARMYFALYFHFAGR